MSNVLLFYLSYNFLCDNKMGEETVYTYTEGGP